jgi:hypothetical protein
VDRKVFRLATTEINHMAQHGYLHDTYDRDDFGRGGDDREGSWRDRDDERSWGGRDRNEESRWQGSDNDWSDRNSDRGSMFGRWRDQGRHSDDRNGDHDRGFFDRSKDEASEWFGGEHRDGDHDRYSSQRNHGQASFGQSGGWSDRSQGQYGRGSQERSAFSSSGQNSRRYSAHPDDHYRSWRDKQVQALDRDYQDYCREREQQFHSDFDTWRQNRQGQRQGQDSQSQGQSSMREREAGNPSNESLELDQVANRGGEVEGATSSPMGAATMGTNNSENDTSAPNATGRGKR